MINLVKEKMPYDDGFDLDFTDRLLYGVPARVNQSNVGSCVGASAGRAGAACIGIEILIEGDAEKPFALFVDDDGANVGNANHAVPFIGYHYGCGKTKDKWNGSRFTGTGWCSDGSFASAQSWALVECGYLPCGEVKGSPGPYPQSSDVRSWGCNRRGELNDHLEIAQQYRVKDCPRIRDADSLWEWITVAKRPACIASSWAFQPREQVDGLGWVYTRRGQWMHQMTYVAGVEYRGRRYFKLDNQWRRAHKGKWYMWVPYEVTDAHCKAGECFGIGEITLPKVDLDNLDLGV
jgi:hypothetical protein